MKKIIIALIIFLSLTQIANAGFIENWVFSKKSYAEHIEIEGYVLTKYKVNEFFKGALPYDIKLNTYGEIRNAMKEGEEIFLFVKIKNEGNKAAWGELDVNINSRNVKINVNFIPVGSRWFKYVIPLNSMSWPTNEDNKIPSLSFNWCSLYAK